MTIDTSKISHTTVQGLLTVVVVSALAVHFDAAGHLDMTARDWFIVGMGFMKGLVGYFQQDAGVTQAYVPGASTPQPVPSHEIPNDPKAIPVPVKE